MIFHENLKRKFHFVSYKENKNYYREKKLSQSETECDLRLRGKYSVSDRVPLTVKMSRSVWGHLMHFRFLTLYLEKGLVEQNG